MDRLRISSRQISDTAQKIRTENAQIPQLIKELEAGMGVLAGCWEGPAWAAYQKTVAEYVELLTEIHKNTEEYAMTYEQAAQDYRRAEQAVCTKLDLIIVV